MWGLAVQSIAASNCSICSGVDAAGRKSLNRPIYASASISLSVSVIATRKITRRDDVERAVVVQADTAMVPGLQLRLPHRACVPLVAAAVASHGQLSR